ncbi:MAG: EamA family transporter [Mycobacteriales bacterium]
MTKRGWVLFLAMCFIWGIPYLLIRVAVRDLSPADLVFARTAIAAAILVPIAAWRGALGGLRGHWKWVLAYTGVELTIPWLLLSTQRSTSPARSRVCSWPECHWSASPSPARWDCRRR